MRLSLVAASGGCSLVVVCRLLIMVASLVERGLQWLQHVGSVAGVLGLRVCLLFTKACTADLGAALPQMISRSICRFDEKSDAIKTQASDDSLRAVVDGCLPRAAALSGSAPNRGPEARQHTARRGAHLGHVSWFHLLSLASCSFLLEPETFTRTCFENN